jgi:cytochrome c556
MHRHGLQALVVVGCLFGLAAGLWAATQDLVPGDVIANRKRLMRLNGASMADIQAKLKAGSIEAIAVNAETIAVMATHIPALFPADSLSGDTRAKPEIAQRKDEFQADAKKLQEAAEKLRDAVKGKDAAAVAPLVKELGQPCSTCHTAFRAPAK